MTLLEARPRPYEFDFRVGLFYEKLANLQKYYDPPHSLGLGNPPVLV